MIRVLEAGGQLQVVVAVYLASKVEKGCKKAIPATISQICGVGEPLMYSMLIPIKKLFYINILGGCVGGVTVKPIAVPGHTEGMLVFLIPEDGIAIFGDACGEHTLLLFQNCAPIETYREGLRHLQQFAGQFDTVLRNHGSFQSPKQILADSIELCGAVLARADAAIPAEFHGEHGLMARPEEHPGKVGNMVYSPDNLFA